MDLSKTVDYITVYAKNGNPLVLEYLSLDSKKQLQGCTDAEIVDSLQRFFQDKVSTIIGNRAEDFGDHVEVYFHDTDTKDQYKLIFHKDKEDEWKLMWSLKAFEQYR